MPRHTYANWGDIIFWVYANLNMLMATTSMGKEKFDRQSFMVRAKAYKAYREGRWKIHSLYENNNWKVDLGKNECWYCHAPIEKCGRLSADHIFPKSLGGDDSFDNIAYVCQSCNSSKGTKDFIEWSVNEAGRLSAIELICIYMKLVYKFSVEHNLLDLQCDDLEKLVLPFNPKAAFHILQFIDSWLSKA